MGNWIELATKETTNSGQPLCREDELNVAYTTRKSTRPKARIIIGKQLATDARWVIGDQVKLLCDPEHHRALLKRVAENGFVLTGAGKSGGPKLKGKCLRCYVGIPITSESNKLMLFPNGMEAYTPAFVDVTEEGIEFSTKGN